MDNTNNNDVKMQPVQPEVQQPAQPQEDWGVQQGLYSQQQPVEQPQNMDVQQNFYGAGGQQPYGAGQYQQPYGGQPVGGKPPKAKKPAKKGTPLKIVIGILIAAAIIVCGIIFIPKLFKSDKEVVKDAFEASKSSTEMFGYASENYNFEEVLRTYKEKGGQNVIAYGIKDINLSDAASGMDMADMAFTATGNFDPINKQLDYNCKVGVSGQEVLQLNVFADETNTYIEFKDLINAYFSLPNDGFLQAIADSYIGQQMDLDTGSFDITNASIDYFSDYDFSLSLEGQPDNIIADFPEELWDVAEVKKQGKAKVTVNGEDIVTKEYYVTIAETDLENALKNLITETTSDPNFADAMGVDAATIEQGVTLINAMIPTLISGDFVFEVYIDDGKVVKITSSDEINFGFAGGTIEYAVNIEMLDDYFNCSASMSVDGEKLEIGFGADEDDTDTKNVITGEVYMIASGESIIIDFMNDLNKSDDAFNGALKVNYNGLEMMGLSYNGKFTDAKSTKKFGVELEDVTMSADGESVSFYIDCAFDTTTVNVNAMDSSKPVYEVSGITEEDFYDYSKEIAMSLVGEDAYSDLMDDFE